MTEAIIRIYSGYDYSSRTPDGDPLFETGLSHREQTLDEDLTEEIQDLLVSKVLSDLHHLPGNEESVEFDRYNVRPGEIQHFVAPDRSVLEIDHKATINTTIRLRESIFASQ